MWRKSSGSASVVKGGFVSEVRAVSWLEIGRSSTHGRPLTRLGK